MADEPGTEVGTPTPAEGEGTAEVKHTLTQADIDRIVETRVAREKAKYADYDEIKSKLTEIEDAGKSELEKLTGERDVLRSGFEKAEAEALRLRVALEKKLPVELIDRLRGSNKDELAADADELLKLVTPASAGQVTAPPSGGVGHQTASEPAGMSDMLRRMAGF